MLQNLRISIKSIEILVMSSKLEKEIKGNVYFFPTQSILSLNTGQDREREIWKKRVSLDCF